MVPPSQRRQVPIRRHRWILILGAVGGLLILGMILVVLLRGGRDSLQESLTAAQAALADGDDVAAVDGFSQVLEDDPDNVVALEGQLEAAANLVQAGQLDAAIIAYEILGQKKPTDVQVLRTLGQIHEARGEWERAAGWYERWTQVALDAEDAFLALGDARFHQAAHEQAVAAYERARKLGSKAAERDIQLGLAYYELAFYDKAIEHLESAAARDLGDYLAGVYYALGRSYLGRQDYQQENDLYEKIRELTDVGMDVWAEEARSSLDQAYAHNAMQDAILHLNFSNLVIEGDATYAVASTGQRAKVEGAVHLEDGPWDGSQALVLEEATTNLLINSSCERDLTIGWDLSPRSGMTLSKYTADSFYGATACKLSATSDGGDFVLSQTIPVTAESDYTFSVWARKIDGDVMPYLWISDVALGSVIATKKLDDLSTNEWKRYSLTVVVPPGTSHIDFGIKLPDDASQGEFLADAFQLEERPYPTTYCDGDQGDGYAWLGIPHASASTRARSYVRYSPSSVALSGGSIAIWIKPGQFYNWPYILGRYPRRFDAYLNAEGNILFRIFDDSGEHGTHLSFKLERKEADNWHQVVFVWAQTPVGGHNVWLYGDGVLRNQASNSYWPTSLPSDYAHIQPGVRRAVAQFATFGRALTPSEISALYRLGVSEARSD